jgi:predicted transcriptional regulator
MMVPDHACWLAAYATGWADEVRQRVKRSSTWKPSLAIWATKRLAVM